MVVRCIISTQSNHRQRWNILTKGSIRSNSSSTISSGWPDTSTQTVFDSNSEKSHVWIATDEKLESSIPAYQFFVVDSLASDWKSNDLKTRNSRSWVSFGSSSWGRSLVTPRGFMSKRNPTVRKPYFANIPLRFVRCQTIKSFSYAAEICNVAPSRLWGFDLFYWMAFSKCRTIKCVYCRQSPSMTVRLATGASLTAII